MNYSNKSTMFRTVLKNWPVLVGLAVLYALWQWNAIPSMLRAFVQVPMFMFAIVTAYLLIRSVFCRSTTDKLGDDDDAVQMEWNALPRGERIKLLIYERIGFILAGAVIVAGLLIVYGGPSGAAAAIEATK